MSHIFHPQSVNELNQYLDGMVFGAGEERLHGEPVPDYDTDTKAAINLLEGMTEHYQCEWDVHREPAHMAPEHVYMVTIMYGRLTYPTYTLQYRVHADTIAHAVVACIKGILELQ